MEPISGRHRVHWSYLLTGAVKNIYRWILFIIAIFVWVVGRIPQFEEYGGYSFENPLLVASIAAVVVLVLAISALQYFHISWEVTDTEVRLRKGVITKADIRVPFDRIHSVSIKANPIERIFGVVNLTFDTAGGLVGGDLVIPSLKKSFADRLRHQISLHKGGNKNEVAEERALQDAVRQESVFSHCRIRPMELIFHGLSNGSAILYIFVGLSFVSRLTDIPFINEIVSGVVETTFQRLNSADAFIIALAVITVLAIAWLLSVVASILKYFGFVVLRRGDRIEVERGLLTHRVAGCSVNRIQEVHIERPLFRRLIGYAAIRVKMPQLIIGGEDSQDALGLLVQPFIKYKEIDGFLREILPEFADAPEAKDGLPAASLRLTYLRYLSRSVIFIVAAFIAAWFALADAEPDFPRTECLSIVSALLLAVICITAYRSWKGRGMATNDDFLVLRRGAYTFTTVIIPRKKIQIARMSRGPLQMRCGVADVDATTAATTDEGIIDVSEDQAQSYLDWIRPRGLR
ncbi:MAG: PH domain-containing protein [Clostridiales Family XIII bacterium]|jgi:putative membrane protein|nr:PH domain-containing protein [Clostridiales Family XIII bacterium]